MVITFPILAVLLSLAGLLIPPIQALFPRISLVTYTRQRLVRRALVLAGILFLIPTWFFEPFSSTWVASAFVLFFWLMSEFVLVPTKIIPPLDNPPAVPAVDAILADETQVLGIVLEGQAHAWPMGILIPHHIINESLHGKPLTAAYCPACRSGYIFDPLVEGQRLTFEPVSVRRRNMIMRDRETGTIWQHETGEALMGKYKGKTLAVLGGELSNWKTWRAEHPGTTVCVRPKGYRHPSPLGPVFERLLDHGPEHIVGPGLSGLDRRLGQHDFIAGIVIDTLATAYPLDVLKKRQVIHDQVGHRPLVIFYDAASDRVRCFSTDMLPQGTILELQPGRLVDPKTGQAWDLSGKGLTGTKSALNPLGVERKWWLAWSEYHPGSRVYTEGS
jgi:hypothetical protein